MAGRSFALSLTNKFWWIDKVRYFRKHFRPSRVRAVTVLGAAPRKVLVLGIILADRKNLAKRIMTDLGKARYHQVVQRWAVLFGSFNVPSGLNRDIVDLRECEAMPRSVLLNALMYPEDLMNYDYIMICDDDVLLPKRFLDDYIALVEQFDFSLSQPARTWYGHNSHDVTIRDRGCIARETRFVEIGPMVCIRRDAFGFVFPLPEASKMGWGLEFVWAKLLSARGKRLGIIDALPIDHSIRGIAVSYGPDAARNDMRKFLKDRAHLSPEESMQTIRRHVRHRGR